jgi:ferredoxin-NADP reductase
MAAIVAPGRPCCEIECGQTASAVVEDFTVSVLDLLFFIVLAMLVQIAAVAVVAYYRHRHSYLALGNALGANEDGDREPSVSSTPSLRTDVAGWPGLRDFRVQRKIIEDHSGSICSFYLAPVDGVPLPAFVPGQYLTFHLEIDDPATQAPKHVVRCYSLSDAPNASHYRVTIKRIAPSSDAPNEAEGLSSGHFHRRVQVGDVLAVKAPAGHFQLGGGESDPIVLVGGGIGITPMLSMLGASLQNTPRREVWLFYGVRNGADHVMKTELQQLANAHANFHLHVSYSRPGVSDVLGVDYDHIGHVDVALLRHTLMAKPYVFYICGPRGMLETLVPALIDWGIPECDIHYEAFGPASLSRKPAKAAADAVHPTVTFGKSNRSLLWTGGEASLLELAENNAIPVESGCRAGGCGACQTKIVSGEVEYSHDPDFDVEAGSCLLCISVPKSDLTLLA